ncbi:FAD-dependent oxidoreductase [Pontibacillus salipaludis]|uniref:Pyridine nucleotide-disulfide oxidoreductase n=1 Tax=Pontibacillus salipaludis TaxID=1697394 RepID=A0ABQ1Q7Q4_9BACI|nr:FAD-dependent oxidoreductase [Pontibacillus salipaludis]GGD17994.1 pyridine nucleotide-disulfide oxidoreductase [Pontibacillus salipaludis]
MKKGRVIVIGGGPAGIEAALTASSRFEEVYLVSEQPAGAWKMNDAAVWQSLLGKTRDVTPQELNAYAQSVHTKWMSEQIDLLQHSGVRTKLGKVAFLSPYKINIENGEKSETIEGDYFIIAVGSRPAFPQSLHPYGDKLMSFHSMHQLKRWPESIVVIGDGPIGFEAVNVFSLAQVKVDWIVPEDGPNARIFEEDLSDYLLSHYEKRGVHIYRGPVATGVKEERGRIHISREDGSHVTAQCAYIVPSFLSNLDRLTLANAEVDEHSIDGSTGQTNQSHIYVVGDADLSVAAVYAQAKARQAVLHIDGKQEAPLLLEDLPLSFHQWPEVASIGLSKSESSKLKVRTFSIKSRNYVHMIEGGSDGWIKVVYNEQGILFGASAVGEGAKDIISMLAIPVKLKQSVSNLQSLFAAHPSQNEMAAHIIRTIADEV